MTLDSRWRGVAAALVLPLTALALEVTSVTARQRLPWNDLVDVDVAVSGTEADVEYLVSLAVSYPSAAGAVTCATLLSEPIVKGDGTCHIVWNAGADLPDMRLTNITVTASVEPLSAADSVYLVFDLSGGSSATSYPHRYMATPPDLSGDACRTTELWMRRCPAGTFTMGMSTNLTVLGIPRSYYYPEHTVVLSKPFYLGVFELTQMQYYLMEGKWPSFFSNVTHRATRPLEMVSYEGLRGGEVGKAGWYDEGAPVDADSPMRRLRTKTGFTTLDLPTEAQWEYACRAGTTGMYSLDGMTYENALEYARNFNSNQAAANTPGDVSPDEGGTAKVGSYPANAWGFYDMYGNVGELCGDGNPHPNRQTKPDEDAFSGVFTDPRGSPEESYLTFDGARVVRGGWWSGIREHLDSGYRNQVAGSQGGGAAPQYGVRLCITCE